MDLSIVIVNWNTRDLLRGCLASLRAAVGDLACEVVVVDNASADDTPAMVRAEFSSVDLIEAGGNLGFARANNLAFPATKGRHVLLLNPDTVCPPGSLARLVSFADGHPGCGGVGPLLTDETGQSIITYGHFPSARYHWLWPLGLISCGPRWARAFQFVYVPHRKERSRSVPYVAGACLLIPRSALERVGGLDDRFFLYFEETDWCRRAWSAGLSIHLCMESSVVHLEGKAAELVSQFSLRQFQHSFRLYLAKHRGRGAVAVFRAALWWENAAKALLRALVPWDRRRNAALARRYAFIARLQCVGRLDVTPPSGS
jgi:N-acetylglucosaminyl-diphospho-decaprenol L-rhamnosyltransferase